MFLRTCTILLITSFALSLQAETFRFSVERSKLLRDQRGQLELDESGVNFRSEDGKTSIQLLYQDIREADISDPRAIHFELYDSSWRQPIGRRTHTFRLLGSTVDEKLIRFLVEKLKRPVIGAYGTTSERAFTVPAFHRHLLGGCHGKIQIGVDAIRFISDRPEHSRTWLYREIETIGSADPFQFRVSSFAETYTFELKDRLDEEAYELAWRQLHPNLDSFERLENSPKERADRVDKRVDERKLYLMKPARQLDRRTI